MISEVRAVLARSRKTMLEDALGVAALFALLVGGLHLPPF